MEGVDPGEKGTPENGREGGGGRGRAPRPQHTMHGNALAGREASLAPCALGPYIVQPRM